jgi:hypothetical protein
MKEIEGFISFMTICNSAGTISTVLGGHSMIVVIQDFKNQYQTS